MAHATGTPVRDEPNKCYVQPDTGDRDFDNQQSANQWMQANPSATVKVTVNGGDNVNKNYNNANANAASTAKSIADAVANGNAELAAQLLNQSSNKNEVLTALSTMVNTNVLGSLREIAATGGSSSSMTNLKNAVTANGGMATGTGSGVGTVTVGNNTYYPAIPVAGATVSAAATVVPGGGITVVKSGCVGKVDISDLRKLEATSGVVFGLFSWGRDNGFEQTTRANQGTKLTYGPWQVIGMSKSGQPVQERVVEGYEYVIFAYEVGGGASSGVVHNTIERATGLNGNQNNSSFGTNVMEFSCSFTQTRELIPTVTPNEKSTVRDAGIETDTETVTVPVKARGKLTLQARPAGVKVEKKLRYRTWKSENGGPKVYGPWQYN